MNFLRSFFLFVFFPSVLLFPQQTGTIKFTDSQQNVVDCFRYSPVFVKVTDPDVNQNAVVIEAVEVYIYSDSQPIAKKYFLFETGFNTGIFFAEIPIDSAGTGGDRLQVRQGERLVAEYTDALNNFGNEQTISHSALYGYTEIPGASYTSDITWRKADSPFLISGDVEVRNNATLTIEPGVEVLFLPGSGKNTIVSASDPLLPELMINNAKLVAVGTETDSIRFSIVPPAKVKNWGGIYCVTGSVELKYAVVEYSEQGLYLITFAPWPISDISVSDSRFTQNKKYSIYIQGYSKDSVFIFNNHIENVPGSYYGINLSGIEKSAVVKDNMIVCTNSPYEVGIRSNRSNTLIKNNTIIKATCAVEFGDYSNNPVIINNNLSFTDFGVKIIGGEYRDDTVLVKYNNFTFDGSSGYAIYNPSIFSVDARGNWWGRKATDEMNSGSNPKNISAIYDGWDDAGAGEVNYSSWTESPISRTIPPPVKITIGLPIGDTGDTVHIPVMVEDMVNAAEVTLKISYDTDELTFLNITAINPQLPGALFGSYNGLITVAWAGLQAAIIESGKLFDMVFIINEAQADSNLVIAPSSEFTYTDGTVLELVVIGGRVIRPPGVRGSVNYDNAALTPLTGSILLKKENQAWQGSLLSGGYQVKKIQNGSYNIEVTPSAVWGGVNSTDALFIIKHIIGQAPLQGLKLSAADVNGNGVINIMTAMLILQRVALMVSSFPAGDWLFDSLTVTVKDSNVTKNIMAICTGDVNGSYNPLAAASKQNISAEVNITAGAEEINLPIYIDNDAEISALTMYVKYPADIIMLEGVKGNMNGLQSYSASGGSAVIAWADIDPLVINKGDVFLTLSFKALRKDFSGNAKIEITEGTELADKNGIPLTGINLGIGSEQNRIPEVFKLNQNYPNPFNPVTTISYQVPKASLVTVEIFNLLGEKIETLVNDVNEPGYYNITWNAAGYSSGIYICRMRADEYVAVKKMSLVK